MSTHPKLANRTCYHKYEIESGLFTPGTFLHIEPKRCLDELGIPAKLTGLRVLEIGSWDGAFTFELARRGAIVTGMDIQDPDVTVFNEVRAILNLSVSYVRNSVYDLKLDGQERFDIVVFPGVYYHLKNPALALQRIREVLKDDGTLYIEGASCSHYLSKELARSLPGTSPETLIALIDNLPISVFDADNKVYKHWSNWWFPTTRCLESMLYDSGFKNVELALKTNAFYNHSHPRLMGVALADPEKPNPGEQQHEHKVYQQDYNAGTPSGPGDGTGVRSLLRRAARKLRKYIAPQQ
jgi:tRNA (mo5U34)-methyltransferase